jgi:hypothetical protein
VNSIDEKTIQEYFDTHQCVQLKVFSHLDNTYHIQAESRPPITDIVSTIIDDDTSHLQLLSTIDLPVISHSSTTTINSTDEHNWWKMYSLRDIDLDHEVINAKRFGKHINVYLVDSGIDINHPEFANQDVNLLFSFTNDFYDNNGHGTALGSLIVGNTCGLTDATLHVVKIFDQNIPTKQSDLLNALNFISEDSAISSNKVSVVNLSWSIPKDSFIESKIRCLINAGLMVIVSSGNSGIPIEDVTPASMPEVFTIGSYGEDFLPSDFSNYSNSAISCTFNSTNSGSLDSWAPGENIYVATPNNNGYSIASGTSLSAAIYSASIAYNMNQYLTINGELPTSYKIPGTDIVYLPQVAYADRTGLLDLSNPKYSSSINRICSYQDCFNIPSDLYPIVEQTVRILAHPNQFTSRRWVYSTSVKSYEIVSDLPAGVTFEGVYINVDIQNQPVSEEHVDLINIFLKVNLKDSDTVIDKKIEIVLVGNLFDPTVLPSDDPLLDLTLDVACKGGVGPRVPPYCNSGYCSNSNYSCHTVGKSCICG